MMKTYRLAIVGLGRMGSTIDAEVVDYPAYPLPYSIAGACQLIPRLQLAAGADILPEKRRAFQEKWGVAALYEDYREMIERERPDVVAICTVGEHHAPMTVEVASLGVPMIFCEKAMACSMAEADAVRDAVRKSGSKFLTGVLRRWQSTYQEARQRIAAGDIGQPKALVHFGRTNLLHGHSHTLDTVLLLLGDPRALNVHGELLPREVRFESGRLERDPDAVFQVEFEGGIEAQTVRGGAWDFEVHGTEGVLKVANDGLQIALRKKTPVSKSFEPYLETVLPPPALPRSPTVTMLDDLVSAHEEGRPTRSDIEVTHHATEILFAIAECHHLGVPRVALPVQNRNLYIRHR
ncbi:MAG: Gfo/Idh/MocA family oxidoreductase [Planctomycetes bacterium]|nr:Gfo/Idh/MocA family oxidoreductase [Planctomycetota bacterium]